MSLRSKIKMMSTAMITPSCEAISKYVSQSMDAPLPWYRQMQVRVHLFGCVMCRNYEKQVLKLREMFQRHASEQEAVNDEITLSEQSRDRIKKVLRK